MLNLFAQDVSYSMDLSLLGYGIALLMLIALVLGVSTVFSHRNRTWKASFSQGLGSLLWASPVIAVLAFVAMRVIPNFQFGTAEQSAANTPPSWLQSEEGSVKVEEVPAFPEVTTPVSIDLEETPEEALPEWTQHKVQKLQTGNDNPSDATWRIVLESKDWDVSVEDARANLARQAAKLLEEDFSRTYSEGTNLSAEQVESLAVRAEAVTEQVFNEASNPFKAYKVYWQVELSPQVREELSGSWKESVATKRAWLMGEVIGLFSLIAATFAAYFHLDKRSNGNHRFRLKMAAAALMTAGALGVLATMSLV